MHMRYLVSSLLSLFYSLSKIIFYYVGFHIFYRLLGQQSAICNMKSCILHLVIVYIANLCQNDCPKLTCLLSVHHNVDFKLSQSIYKLGGSNCAHVRSSRICSLICSHKSNCNCSNLKSVFRFCVGSTVTFLNICIYEQIYRNAF